ncbi:hypothetical protein BUE80_DR001817 [Diplocarpon rosae]|nr:hypothetical protein BUE80_DR001817 [Diplocarpon rosae]
MLILQKIRAILRMVKTSIPKFDFMNNDQWSSLRDIQISGRDPTQDRQILAYRSVEKSSTTTKDRLRFEQRIAGGSGRIVLSIPVTFEKEFVNMEKGLLSQKTLGTPCDCGVVKEKFFATCKCVRCGKALNFYNQVKLCEEVGKLRWFLERKDDKVIQEKMFENCFDGDAQILGEKEG